jgi:hypothetical protein
MESSAPEWSGVESDHATWIAFIAQVSLNRHGRIILSGPWAGQNSQELMTACWMALTTA